MAARADRELLSRLLLVLASLAVIVSKNSNTAGVIQAGASGFGNVLDVAISPVTGATTPPNLSYPGGMGTGNVYGGFSPSPVVNMYG